jgi:glycosyltransferase involved in cell wall biosynthesis
MNKMASTENNIFLTVFTPTYNRAEYLKRGYTSLVNQTYKSFEWIIIDDGSTDNTKEVVDSFTKEKKINIQYHYQENSGKHNAHNKVLQLAKGKFLLVLDSDDCCKDNAFEILLSNWNQIPEKNKESYIGVTGLCEDQNGKVVGDYFPCSPFDSTSVEKYYKYNIKGEKWGMMRTDVLKQYKFPEKKSSFYPEAYVWFKIALKYKTRYISEVVRVYYVEAKDCLTKPKAITRSTAEAVSDYNLFLINNFFKYYRYHPLEFIKYFIQYVSYASFCGKKFTRIISHLNSPVSKAIGTLLYPASMWYIISKKNLVS